MRIYSTKVVIIFALFCTNSLIRAGTQRLAKGGLQNAAHPNELDEEAATHLTAWTNVAVDAAAHPHPSSDAQFIDSGQAAASGGHTAGIVKRTPSGFMGMRGKKAADMEARYSGFGNWDAPQYPSASFGAASLLGPQYDDFANEDVYTSDAASKRVPSGFLGMRGKKHTLLEHELMLLEYIQAAAAAAAAADRNRYYGDDSDIGGDAIGSMYEKRAPAAGFLGMRGKRDPMVGVGSSAEDEEEDSETVDAPHYATGNHNGAMMGFNFKRAPAMGFMGMRGKKAPAGFGFFGTRGKKVPIDFRGKFVGVRGKKVPGGVAMRDFVQGRGGEFAMPEMQSGHVMRSSAQASEAESSKRAPSGFHGMRGKKWSMGDENSFD